MPKIKIKNIFGIEFEIVVGFSSETRSAWNQKYLTISCHCCVYCVDRAQTILLLAIVSKEAGKAKKASWKIFTDRVLGTCIQGASPKIIISTRRLRKCRFYPNKGKN